ncbi:MAG TPA: hypothetical protein ENI94_11050 [Gammaproteobacteria bacterium]|nr:hypothetical protein [Gammaproteobacteria bacterium]
MDLKEFVTETLVSIVEGVKAAQERVNNNDAFVNPGGLMRNTKSVDDNAIWDNRTNNYARYVTFDVAVTAEDSSSGGAKIKVLPGILGGDVGGEKGNKNTIASRVQFTVPVLLPSHDVGDRAARSSLANF